MSEIVNKFFMVSHKFMPELHLKQPGLIYSALWSVYKKQRKNWKNSADWKYKFCFNSQINFIRRLLENSKHKKFIHLLETILGMLIWMMCNH